LEEPLEELEIAYDIKSSAKFHIPKAYYIVGSIIMTSVVRLEVCPIIKLGIWDDVVLLLKN